MAVIALMGSGETSPTMVKVHRMLLNRLGGDPRVVFLDTPFGFQENADVLTQKVADYFATSLQVSITAPPYRGADATEYQRQAMLDAVRTADYVFAGPGSPSYALQHWHAAGLRDAAAEALANGGTITLASAAAVTAGALAIPVYEIYKVGHDPHWLEGLSVLDLIGVSAVVVPHFNNKEGGDHDTRYCYMGKRRFDVLRSDLAVPVLGVDEHTAVVLDGTARTGSVLGKGLVTIVSGDTKTSYSDGETFLLDELFGTVAAGAGTHGTRAVGSLDAFDEALAGGDVASAADVILNTEDAELTGRMVVRLAQSAERGLTDPADTIAPFVELLIRLRDEARARQDWAGADLIRDALVAAGVEVRDSPAGSDWSLLS